MKLKAFKAAFPNTIPILAGYLCLGFGFGVYMNSAGFHPLYSFIMPIVIFAGSLQYVAVEVLLAPFAPVQVTIMALMLHLRHVFYGISMLEKYKGLGIKKAYIIYGLTDETFTVNYSAKIPPDVDKGWFYFFVTLLDHSYWICGCTLGAVVGSFLPFSTEGISFVMTAMFTVILYEQLEQKGARLPVAIGIVMTAACLLIFGKDNFLVPSMIAIVVMLVALKKPLSMKADADEILKQASEESTQDAPEDATWNTSEEAEHDT